MRSAMRSRAILACLILILACAGCGRKLPPLPPTQPDPVEIRSARFEGAEVMVRALCNVPDAEVLLLGKPKGICPHCTDDLTVRHTVSCEKAGEVLLRDASPESDYMVYRVGIEFGSTKWTTPPQIVVKKR